MLHSDSHFQITIHVDESFITYAKNLIKPIFSHLHSDLFYFVNSFLSCFCPFKAQTLHIFAVLLQPALILAVKNSNASHSAASLYKAFSKSLTSKLNTLASSTEFLLTF